MAAATGLVLINVGQWVKDKELHCGWDEEHQAFILDEDKVCFVCGCVLCVAV